MAILSETLDISMGVCAHKISCVMHRDAIWYPKHETLVWHDLIEDEFREFSPRMGFTSEQRLSAQQNAMFTRYEQLIFVCSRPLARMSRWASRASRQFVPQQPCSVALPLTRKVRYSVNEAGASMVRISLSTPGYFGSFGWPDRMFVKTTEPLLGINA